MEKRKTLIVPVVPFVPQNNFVCIKLIFLYKLFQRAGQSGQTGQRRKAAIIKREYYLILFPIILL